MKLINIGYGNFVSANRVIALISPESAPVRQLIDDARQGGKLIDATYARRIRAVLVMDNDCVVLSAIQPDTVAARFEELRIESGELRIDTQEE